jgi:transposase-like protein
MPLELPELVTMTEIAQQMHVHPKTVSRWRKRYADFPAPSLAGRFLVEDVQNFIQKHTHQHDTTTQ